MPRMGMGMPLVATAQSSAINVQDFFFDQLQGDSNLSPIHTASRTNSITNSEDFSSGAGGNLTNISVATNTVIAPNGTQTADTITPTTTNGIHTRTYSGSSNSATSVFAKANGYTKFRINTASSGNGFASFDLSNGTVATGGTFFSSASIEEAGNGFFRCSLVVIGGGNTPTIAIENAGGNVSFAGDGTSGIHFWGVQQENNTEVGAYIPTSGSAVTVATTLNDTHDIWDFDTADLMPEEDPDSEGVWERPSNIVLNHDYADLGAELVTNGDYTNGLTGWNTQIPSGQTVEVISNQLHINYDSTETQGSTGVNQSILTVGKIYKVIIDVASLTGSFKIQIGNKVFPITSAGVHTFHGTPTSGNNLFVVRLGNGTSFDALINSVSAKEVDPNARWTKAGLATIENGVAKFLDDGTNTNSSITQSGFPANTTYELVFAITRYVAGRIQVLISSDSYNVDISGGVGTYTVIIQPAGSTSLTIKRDGGFSGFDFDIDNVTLKEYAITPLDV